VVCIREHIYVLNADESGVLNLGERSRVLMFRISVQRGEVIDSLAIYPCDCGAHARIA
jgi:hypothetical protein